MNAECFQFERGKSREGPADVRARMIKRKLEAPRGKRIGGMKDEEAKRRWSALILWYAGAD
jgi:hypothetical protein